LPQGISRNYHGSELFNNFCRTLQGAAKDNWDWVIGLIPTGTDVTFCQAIELWKYKMILPTAHQNLVDYLENLTKPCQMTVEAFVNRLKVMLWYVTNMPFPGPDPLTNKTQKHHILGHACYLADQFSASEPCVYIVSSDVATIYVTRTILCRPSTKFTWL
jgi:hypothetical protein